MGMSLGERMKRYEQCSEQLLPLRTWTVLRVDGRAFHTYTRRMEKPYDPGFVAAMDAVILRLVAGIDNAAIGYVQSDEVSVLSIDRGGIGAEPWFGGRTAKQISVGASMATAAFLSSRFAAGDTRPAEFDARSFTLPDPSEVRNYLFWRQQDCVRNSLQSLARAHFPHNRLRGLKSAELQELLFSEKGVNWAHSDPGFKNGRMAVRTDTGWQVVPAENFATSETLTAVLTREP